MSNNSPNDAQELEKLTGYFAAVGITLVPFQSSESGGWQLYFFFDCCLIISGQPRLRIFLFWGTLTIEYSIYAIQRRRAHHANT